PASVASAELLYGKPIHEVRFPLSSLPHFEDIFARRKAAFHQDLLLPLERFHSPEVLELLKRMHPARRALDAPICVEDRPYGVLSVQGQGLTPVSAATLELFARQVGGALENVRHHRLAAARLAELSRLQA
ncbi:MAG TPA: GAF domain-containing protein, partial [Myxococcaceae bacterium]|nr:GAF domain-containing protein [Myxococcaceae bacterium]